MNEKKKIMLDKSVLVALYKTVLIDSSIKSNNLQTIVSIEKNKEIRVITESIHQTLPEGQLNFLTAILKACKIQIPEVEIICISPEKNYLYTQDGEKGYKKTILFGVTPEQIGLPIRFPHFQIQQFEKCIYLSAPDLVTVEQDKKLKADLWQCLQKIFN